MDDFGFEPTPITVSNCTIQGGGDAEAKKTLASAIKANAEAAFELAKRMSSESYGIYIEGDTHNHTHLSGDEPEDAPEQDEDYLEQDED